MPSPDEPLLPRARWSNGVDPDIRDVLLDSREGAETLMRFARAGAFVLNGYHRDLAARWGVSTDGVAFTAPLSASPRWPPVRLKLRLSFRNWSRAVDRNGLDEVRAWLTRCEAALDALRVHPDPA